MTRLAYALFLLTLVAHPSDGRGAEVRAWDFETFGRLILDFGEEPSYRIETVDREVRVVFDSAFPGAAEAGLTDALNRLERFVETATFAPDGTDLTLTTTTPMRVNDFAIDQGVALDLWPLQPTDAPEAPSGAEQAEQSAPARPAEPGQIAAAVPAPVEPTAPEPTAGRVDATIAEAPAAVPEAQADPPAPAPDIDDLARVRVRTGQHPGFSRVVLDLPRTLDYRVVRVEDTVIAEIDLAAMADLSRTRAHPLTEVDAIHQISDGGNLELAIAVNPETRVRYFYADRRLVVDVIGAGRRVAPIPGSQTANVVADRVLPDLPSGPVQPPLPTRRPEPAPIVADLPDPPVPDDIIAAAADAVGATPAADDATRAGADASAGPEPAADTPELEHLDSPTPMLATPAPAPEPAPAQAATGLQADEAPLAPMPRAEAEAADEPDTVPAPASPPAPVAPGPVAQDASAPPAGDAAVPAPLGNPDLLAVAAGGAPPAAVGTGNRSGGTATLPALPELPSLDAAGDGGLTLVPRTDGGLDLVQSLAAMPTAGSAEIPLAIGPDELAPPPPADAPVRIDQTVDFAFDEAVRGAAFRRGDGLWLVFQTISGAPLDVETMVEEATATLGEADRVSVPSGIALRFPIAIDRHPHVRQVGEVWSVGISGQPDVPEYPIELAVEPDAALGGRVIVPMAIPGNPVTIVDPVIGDSLVVATVADADRAVSQARVFAQFQVLASAAGVALVPRIDTLTIDGTPDGLAIASPDGLALSRTEVEAAADLAALAGPRILDLEGWHGTAGAFLDDRSALQRRVARNTGVERDRARLDLARFLFANGQVSESLGILDLVAGDNAWLVDNDPSVLAMRGAAHALLSDGDAALTDLDAPTLIRHPEVGLWRAVVAAQRHDWPGAGPAFAAAHDTLLDYPDWLLASVAPFAIESYLETEEVNDADDVLNELAARPIAEAVQPALDYWRGRVAARRNDPLTARTQWQSASAGPDRLYRRRAEMALIDLARADGTLDVETEIQRLEELRFAWRGDGLEFEILDQLGEAYWRASRLRDAITIWQQAMDDFPALADAAGLGDRVPRRLSELFSAERIGELPPFHVLALYREYQDILAELPEWRDIRLRLAERLVDVDLLEEAGDLLVSVMTELPADVERARVGARAAAIRLLDRRPQAALNTLDASLAGAQSDPQLAHERRLLRARALSEVNETDAALVLLEDDDRPLTLATRLDVAWRARDWPLAAATLDAMIEPPPGDDATLSAQQARLVLNRAIALGLSGDQPGLDALADAYGPALAGTAYDSTFAMIARPAGTGRLSDLDTIRAQVAEVDMFESFLSSYRDRRTELAPAVN